MPPLAANEEIARILRSFSGRKHLLLHSYVCRCGLKAHSELRNQTPGSFLWNSLISESVRSGKPSEALDLFRKMQENGPTHQLDSFLLLELVKVCIKQKDLESGSQIHQYVAGCGLLQTDPFLQSAFVNMYAKCGSMEKANDMICTVQVKDVVSWTALINGYVENDQWEEALSGLAKMQQEGISPDAYTFSGSLKACSNAGALEKGQQLHFSLLLVGLEKNVVVSTSLIDMYAKNDLIEDALQVFETLTNRNIVSWNALLAGFIELGLSQKALECFHLLQNEPNSPDDVTFTCVLQACGQLSSSISGEKVHSLIINTGADKDFSVGNTLIDMYFKCSLLAEAETVFNCLPNQSVVSWNALIGGYVEHELGNKALSCFKKMDFSNISPNQITFLHGLKACGDMEAEAELHNIHMAVLKRGYEINLLVSNTLIDVYAKNGMFAEARRLFDRLLQKDNVSWAVMISGYIEYDWYEEGLSLITKMQHEQLSFEWTGYSLSLKICVNLRDTNKGQELHGKILRKGVEKDPCLANSLLGMYINCGLYAEAHKTIDSLQVRTTSLWNTLIKGCIDLDLNKESLYCFELMQYEGLNADSTSYTCCLQACSALGLVGKGQQLHAKIVEIGLEHNVIVNCTIIEAYSKRGFLVEAHQLFCQTSMRTVFPWTALITGLVDFGSAKEVFECWELMQCEGTLPDVVMYTCALRASVKLGALYKGMHLHMEIVKRGLEQDCNVGSTLVFMYCKCNALLEGQNVFDNLIVRTEITWTVLLAGYLEYDNGYAVLKCLDQIHKLDNSVGNATLVPGLKACAGGGNMSKAHGLCNQIFLRGMETNTLICTSLLNMYAKGGFLLEAQRTFDKLLGNCCASWSVLMNSYADMGETRKVFDAFDDMLNEGNSPDMVIFLSLLKACAHAGLVDEGENNFCRMMTDFEIIPDLEHCGCIIDLFSRAGSLDKASLMASSMPLHPTLIVCQTLMGHCRKWKNKELGMLIFEQLLELDEMESAPYVCISNIYVESLFY